MSLLNCALCRAIGEKCMDCEPEFDMPPQVGHALPQWLRNQFSAIEDEAMRLGGCAVFTQMRTKVQAYFEMLRADLSYAVVLAERDQLKAENEALRAMPIIVANEYARLMLPETLSKAKAEKFQQRMNAATEVDRRMSEIKS